VNMDTITLQLTAIAHGGAALGRHEGRVIFVPYALPGETVCVEITEDKGRYAFARLVEVLDPSPDRVVPPCPYFGPAGRGGTGCGGCQWQHIDYPAQLRFKATIVADQLTRIGSVADPVVRATLPDSSGWAYRNHVQFHPAPGEGLGFQGVLARRPRGQGLRAEDNRRGLGGEENGRGLRGEENGRGLRGDDSRRGLRAEDKEQGPRAKGHDARPEPALSSVEGPDRGVVAVDECLILHPLLSDLYATLDLDLPDLVRLSLRAGTETGDLMLIFEMADDLPPALEIDLPVSCVLLLSDGMHVNLIGNNHITEIVADRTYRISAPSFFQVNTPQAAQVVQQVLNYLDLKGGETILDAYCGVGLFTVHLAEHAGLVVGVESAPTAVADLLENTADMDNVEVIEGPVEAVLPDLDISLDCAVVDPPRAGVDRFALDALVACRPARLVYVSCDPATLSRDAKRLARAGYRLVEVQPVDMFPQTYHIESVAYFVPAT
jgi:23S rRNA (uracil1939-C5)-methyltransferase